MGRVKIKFNKIRETLNDFDICNEDREIIDELMDLERNLKSVYEYAKLVDQYGDETRKNVRTVMRADEEISKLFESSAIYPSKRLDKKIIKLAKRICTKAHMIDDALDIIKLMTNLKDDPTWQIIQMIYHAEFNNDAEKLRKLIERHVLKVIAESPEKPDIDTDALLEKDVDDENMRKPVTVEVVVGIRDIHLDDSDPKNVYLDDGAIKAEVITKGKESYLQITQTKDLDKTNTYQLAIKRRVTGGSTASKQRVMAKNLALFINEMMQLSTCRAVQSGLLVDKYGLDIDVLRLEPENDKNEFFENCKRLSIYIEIVTANGVFQYAYASTYNAYARDMCMSHNLPDTHYLKYETSECEDFESKFDPTKMLINMEARPLDEE